MIRRLALAATALAVVAPALASGATPTWVATHPVQTGSRTTLSGLRNGTVWAVVDHSRVLRSTDAGLTWAPVNPVPVQSSDVPVPLSGPTLGGSSDTIITAVSADKAYAANGGAFSLTVDAGNTWKPLVTPSVTASKFFEWSDYLDSVGPTIAYARGGSNLVAGCPKRLPTTPLLMTDDDTRRWRRADIPHRGSSVWAVKVAPDRRHLAAVTWEYTWTEHQDEDSCGYSGSASSTSVWSSADGGRHWRKLGSCKPSCWGLGWVGNSRLVAVRVDGQVLTSTNGGRLTSGPRIFEADEVKGFAFVQALDFDGRRGWASVNGVGIYGTPDGGQEWVKEVSLQEAPGLSIGDLTAIDGSRAVSGGPHALLTRTTSPVGVPSSPALTGRVAVRVDLGPGRWMDGAGVMHVEVSVPRR